MDNGKNKTSERQSGTNSDKATTGKKPVESAPKPGPVKSEVAKGFGNKAQN